MIDTDSPIAVATNAPELEIARDLARRGMYVVPVAIVGGLLGWGVHGAVSAGLALALVVVNFLLAAAIMAKAARISPAVLAGAIMGSYVGRLGLLLVAILLVGRASWFSAVPFGVTLISSHLLLLLSETRYISASLAFPALKPRTARARTDRI